VLRRKARTVSDLKNSRERDPIMSISAQTRTALFLVGAGVLLFGSAGTFLIPAFWLYLAVLTAVFIVSFVMLDPELLHERMRPGGNPLPFGVMLATLVFSLHWVVAGLDRGRFHLSDTVPLPLQAVGFFVKSWLSGPCA
jgi:hypothetical protein